MKLGGTYVLNAMEAISCPCKQLYYFQLTTFMLYDDLQVKLMSPYVCSEQGGKTVKAAAVKMTDKYSVLKANGTITMLRTKREDC